ncbi:site-specific DNA-methyltransferase [Burkholderia pseudomallei]|uniref:site-specific DNA-methyltransferase n=1 Tax=Burkholderia pseudomallei TaxID=28450 RepID=UPI0004F7C210|nr:site-specific DNA-methyltransferase [Burkholderia pseudomallei]AIP17257.1 DNA methylase family protein [Burkholderia pseudomallei]AJX11381.1 RNA cap guanine-N2 methyltransferase family protein [Burkholderia pseudomallei 1026b]RXS79825.1 site-specific DNA-methyltransferase [Burkholderia pseudomallei]CAJ3311528.1 DNA methylase N-4/N-6 [Burkholderia pseudomallei]CAJ3329781.1 DNA methylase N-4/N-6 [Burkholderia pseudomallei]
MKKISKEAKEKSQLTKEEWKEYTKTVWSIANVGHSEHPAVFPEELPLRLIKLFSFWGETVLDPFGGTGTTASVALSLGRSAISVDQNERYVAIAHERCQALPERVNEDAEVQVVHGDSRDLSFMEDGSASLIVTSPPYWDKADYGDIHSNIGRRDTYVAFLDNMRDVFRECLRVLEPGRKICVNTANVNQFTEHGLLTFPIAADFCVILRELGFVMVNELIWSKDKTGGRWGSANAQRPIFGSYPYPPNFLFKNIHEYILIFAKPNGELRKGEKVRPYSELMGMQIKEVAVDEGKPSDKAPPRRTVRSRRNG